MLKFDKRSAAEIIAAGITGELEAALAEDLYRAPDLDETK